MGGIDQSLNRLVKYFQEIYIEEPGNQRKDGQ